MQNRHDNFFAQLPAEIFNEIFIYLNPEMLANSALVNKQFNIAAHNNFLWEAKFKRHFPGIVNTIKIKDNWYSEFCKAYADEYAGLPLSVRKLFSLLKENDEQSIKKIKKIPMETLYGKNKHATSLKWLATKLTNQNILDHFYKAAKCYFTTALGRIDTTKKDMHNNNILVWAIGCNQKLKEITLLISKGSMLNDSDYQRPPLYLAASKGRLDIVEFFFQQQPEPNPNILDFRCQTLLLCASAAGHLPVVQYLLSKKGIDLNAATHNTDNSTKNNGRTALHWAAYNGHTMVVDALVKAGALLTLCTSDMQFQPLHLAASEGNLEIVKILVEKQPDLLNQVDKFRQTPLIMAASKGHLPVVRYLLSKMGDNLNAATHNSNYSPNNGRTALHWAACNGHTMVVDALVKAGATLTLRTSDMKFQPLHLAASEGNLEIVKILVEKQPDLLNQVDEFGQTPLLWAASQGHLPVVRYLLSIDGIDLNAATHNTDNSTKNNGRTALHWAAMHGHSEIVDLLLQHSAKLNSHIPIDKSKLTKHINATFTLLERLAEDKWSVMEVMDSVVNLGVDPNTKDANGNSLLHLLSSNKQNSNGRFNREITELVREHKADINIQNDHGLTPLESLIQGSFKIENAQHLIHLGAKFDFNKIHSNTFFANVEQAYKDEIIRTVENLENWICAQDSLLEEELKQFEVIESDNQPINIRDNSFENDTKNDENSQKDILLEILDACPVQQTKNALYEQKKLAKYYFGDRGQALFAKLKQSGLTANELLAVLNDLKQRAGDSSVEQSEKSPKDFEFLRAMFDKKGNFKDTYSSDSQTYMLVLRIFEKAIVELDPTKASEFKKQQTQRTLQATGNSMLGLFSIIATTSTTQSTSSCSEKKVSKKDNVI